MKFIRSSDVNNELLAKAVYPEALLKQIADTLQMSMLRAGDIRAQLFDGKPKVVTGSTLHREGETMTTVEVTLEIQTLAEAVSDCIDAYTVWKLQRSGELIAPDLLFFLDWLKTIDNPPETQ